ncbi:hypothetical protein [Streptosporangium sp. CA-115845]|uniref:hypothetical protein n=1 Tax=Streptosporangium sp. CA-115845 TaxID=3240071 RepID=UPI003D9198BA
MSRQRHGRNRRRSRRGGRQVFWFGATRRLIRIDEAEVTYRVSKRLWALAAHSRFTWLGPVRLSVTVSGPTPETSVPRGPR